MSKKQKKIMLRIILSAVLFVVVCLSSLEGIWQLIAFLAPYFLIGYDVLWSAARNILHGQIFDEKFLMTIATVSALFIGEYPEAVVVMLFYQVGELFQSIAVGKSRRSIAALMDIRPDYAVVLRDGIEKTVSPEEVLVGEVIIVRPGEKIPLDGIIIEGTTMVNASALTGESLPQDKVINEPVFNGTVNLSGVIKVKTQREFGESTVSKILDLIENSAAKKARIEDFITRFARYYTPCVVMGALLLTVIPPLFFAQDWSQWLNRALIFLVVSCPCALVISVPLSFFGGIGGASKEGILIKGASYMEVLASVNTLVFDKTGTLTKGYFSVTAIHPETVSEEDLLHIAAFAESYSSHPIAESIINIHGGHIDKSRIGEISELSGLGVKAVIDGKTVYVGNSKLMDRVGTRWHDCHLVGTTVHISDENEYLGHIIISDELKADAKKVISDLYSLGISKIVMLTGDTKKVSEAIATILGISHVQAELLPAQKVDAVEKLLKDSQGLAFVGDGINDAPVLSRADVGIAMGTLGSDAAIEAADIVIMDDKLSKIHKAIRISRKTMGIVKQNIWFALSVKAIVLILGAAGLANMWIAVFADVGVMVLAIINAMRAMNNR